MQHVNFQIALEEWTCAIGPEWVDTSVAEMRESAGDPSGTGEPAGVMILEHHCAIREAAERFPAICAAELEFFQDVLGADVERRTHILEGCNRCEYRITERTAADDTNGTTITSITTMTTAGRSVGSARGVDRDLRHDQQGDTDEEQA